MKTIFTETVTDGNQDIEFRDTDNYLCVIRAVSNQLIIRIEGVSCTALSSDHIIELIPRLQSWVDGKGLHINPKRWAVTSTPTPGPEPHWWAYNGDNQAQSYRLPDKLSAQSLCDLLNRLDP